MEIFGIRAFVYIKYVGSLEELGSILSESLHLPGFDFDTNSEPPHQLIGSCEALGTEVWLKGITKNTTYNYLLELESEHCLKESFNDKMYNMSPWLSRYIHDIAGIECFYQDEK